MLFMLSRACMGWASPFWRLLLVRASNTSPFTSSDTKNLSASSTLFLYSATSILFS